MATPLHTVDNKLELGSGQADRQDPMKQSLQLHQALQTTLDPTRLIELFSREVQSLVPHDGVAYHCESLGLSCQLGRMSRHSCAYNLNIGDEPLGEILFRRRRPFLEGETAELENALCHLLYPLRNALLYQDALQLSQKDPLTGVCNRAAWDEALGREMCHALRQGSDLSLLVLDLDHFKSINDRYGHIIGDCVLKQVAETIRSCMRNNDQLFRYGGEEFVVLMRDTKDRGACLLAERIRRRIAATPCHCAGADIAVTISAGVSTFHERDTAAEFFGRADQALYLAKEAGRDQVRCAPSLSR